MDNIFQEEQNNLAEMESKLDDIASHHERRVDEYAERIRNYTCVDYEDRMQMRELHSKQNSEREAANKFRSYQDSPYFGRIDMDCSDDEEILTVYVGKEGISDNAEYLVIDWRAPLGACYYASNQKEFKINGYDYTLLLRRALNIKNKSLISYKTEYDAENISLEGDVIDPFLLTVLKDKRRHNRLTDIIKTIQGNQNEIIRKPLKENFVVQGCAGSGKTMILLHRLSYLKFNNRNLSLSGVKIITPNKFFDAHINDLSDELGLGDIERFSVEEFYASLIKRYSNSIKAHPEVHSEKILASEMLAEIYSIQYMNDSDDHYHAYWESVLCELDSEKLEQCFMKFGIVFPDVNRHTSDTASKLEHGILDVADAIVENVKKQKEIQHRLNKNVSDINALTTELERVKTNLNLIKNQTITRLTYEISQLEKQIESDSKRVEELSFQKAEADKQIKSLNADLAVNSELYERMSRNVEDYCDYDCFEARKDDICTLIEQECHSIIEKIRDGEEDLRRTPVYSFGRRNRLRNDITNLKNRFRTEVTSLLAKNEKSQKKNIEAITKELESATAGLNVVNDEYQILKKSQRNLQKRQQSISSCLNVFRNSEFPNTDTELGVTVHKNCETILTHYEEQKKVYERLLRRLEATKNTRDTLEEELEAQRNLDQMDEYESYIERCEVVVKKLRFNAISRGVMLKDLLAVYKKYNQSYSKANYRHKLYLKLLYCEKYFDRMINAASFLNIDEAQDISVPEYFLMQKILGTRCVFNLYGDVNQVVYNYKGIADWKELSPVVGENIYVLNENYRNTSQITEFCNREFHSEVFPIGVNGEAVHQLNIQLALQWIIDTKKGNPESRAAVIYRYGLKAVLECLRQYMKGDNVSWNEVNDDKISIVSVEQAKGLEFEAVVVVTYQMTENEKYISYTRALDRLVVVCDNFSPELDEEKAEEGIEEEFLEIEEEIPHIANIPEEDDKERIANADVVIVDGAHHTDDEELIIAEYDSILEQRIGTNINLNLWQQEVVLSLLHGEGVACDAPTGSMKSLMLYMVALKEHKATGHQTFLTAESFLQENELVMAEQFGLRCGVLSSVQEFSKDFKRDAYDIIFIPASLLEKEEDVSIILEYFTDKIAYWGVDHPCALNSLFERIESCANELNATLYLMSREGFGNLQIEKFKKIREETDRTLEQIENRPLYAKNDDDKTRVLLENVDELFGQGIIYCENESTCRQLSKQLRKSKIKAEAYIEVNNSEKQERIHYLTNSFSKGGLPILVTTHEVGMNISNPKIRFIVHYDIPVETKVYEIHKSQIGITANQPVMYDITVLDEDE